jgi:hypothetical protein
MFLLKLITTDGQNGVFHRQPPESGVPSRYSIGQAPDQITRESIPAPAVPSADLIPPSFTRLIYLMGIQFLYHKEEREMGCSARA